MAFQYYSADQKVVDDATGIEILQKGRGEVNLWRFVFVDPKTSIRTFWKIKELPFYAVPVLHTVYADGSNPKRPAGSPAGDSLDGFKINELQLQTSFAAYTNGDPQKFAEVRRLVAQGLEEWLRNRGSSARAGIIFERPLPPGH